MGGVMPERQGAGLPLSDAAAVEIRERARAMGFSLVGISEALNPDDASLRLQEWLDRGFHAGMAWMRTRASERSDPRILVPGARSVISVALNYFTPHRHSRVAGAAKISRYAWGDDYHEIMSVRLKALWDWMCSRFSGIEGKWYADTGPVLDKVWAQRGGIGWIGKNANVITQEFGSWVFLGEIITTLELPPDSPATDHCGTCTLCIDACPTEAIVQPYVVDSNKCLSYLTIEHRGPVEGDITNRYEGWLFGCDVCQDVCPWNDRFARPCADDEFQPREGNLAPDLDALQAMTEREFRSRFDSSPVLRARYEGFMRNVGIVKRAERG